jgi:serralysin
MMKRLLTTMGVAGTAVLVLTSCMLPQEVSALDYINGDRSTQGAGALGQDGSLINKAQAWSAYLANNSGGQCSMATLVHSDLRSGAPANWRSLGENVGCRIAPGDLQSHVAPLQASFMASPGHRANIMNGNYNVGGVGFASVPAAVGGDWWVVYETQEFAQV